MVVLFCSEKFRYHKSCESVRKGSLTMSDRLISKRITLKNFMFSGFLSTNKKQKKHDL